MELMQSAIQTHVYTIYFFLSLMLFNLYSVTKEKNFIVLAKRLKFMTPLYHLTNAIVIYTGTIVAFYAKKVYTIEISVIVVVYIISKVF